MLEKSRTFYHTGVSLQVILAPEEYCNRYQLAEVFSSPLQDWKKMFMLHNSKDGSDTFPHSNSPNKYIYSRLIAFMVFVIQ